MMKGVCLVSVSRFGCGGTPRTSERKRGDSRVEMRVERVWNEKVVLHPKSVCCVL